MVLPDPPASPVTSLVFVAAVAGRTIVADTATIASTTVANAEMTRDLGVEIEVDGLMTSSSMSGLRAAHRASSWNQNTASAQSLRHPVAFRHARVGTCPVHAYCAKSRELTVVAAPTGAITRPKINPNRRLATSAAMSSTCLGLTPGRILTWIVPLFALIAPPSSLR